MSTRASIHDIIRDTEEILRDQFDCPATVRFFMDRMAQGIFESLGWDDGSDTEFSCDDCYGSGIHRETVTQSGVEITLRVLCHCVEPYLRDICGIMLEPELERPQIKFHCPGCDCHQPAEIEKLQKDDLNDGAWGDVICTDCRLVIATFSAEQEGELVYVPTTAAVEGCWIPIEEAEIGTNQHAWLVKVKSSPLVAMGVLVGAETWKVQPLFSKWYVANDVTHVCRMAQ